MPWLLEVVRGIWSQGARLCAWEGLKDGLSSAETHRVNQEPIQDRGASTVCGVEEATGRTLVALGDGGSISAPRSGSTVRMNDACGHWEPEGTRKP